MRILLVIVGLLVIAGFVIYCNKPEFYEISYTVILPATGQYSNLPPGGVCYSRKQLREILGDQVNPEMKALFEFDLDSPDLFACFIRGHKIQRVVGREDLGFIILSPDEVSGTTFAVVKGNKKRLFQFNRPYQLSGTNDKPDRL